MQGGRSRVDQLAQALMREDWQVLSAGAGGKGPRLFAWARIELVAPEISGWQRWLLIRRSLDEGADPAEMAYVLIFAPTGTSLEEMVEAFGARWTVEQCFEEAKGEVGLDEYEVRRLSRVVSARYFVNVELSLLNGLTSLWGRNHSQKKPEQLDSTPEPEAPNSDHLHRSSDLPMMVPLSTAERDPAAVLSPPRRTLPRFCLPILATWGICSENGFFEHNHPSSLEQIVADNRKNIWNQGTTLFCP